MQFRLLDWDSLFTKCEDNPDSMWNVFMETIIPILNCHVPLRIKNSKKSNVSPKVKKLCRKAWNLHKKWKTEGSAYSKRMYLEASKLAQREKRKENFNNESKILRSGNLDSFWKFVKSKLSYKSSIPCLLDSNKSVISDGKQKADLLNHYFCSVYNNDDGVDQNWSIDEPESYLSEITVSPAQVYHKLKNLPPKMSSGPDGLPSFLLKKIATVLDTPFSKIFNASLKTGKIPIQWREAKVIALFKKGDNSLPSNYRPISLTCVACRILESIIADSIKAHISDAIFSGQHGFLSKKSTVTQLLESVNDWVNELDDNKCVDIAFIDFAKAFDTVSHKKLLLKLKQYGISGKTLDWIQDFLSNRTQKVCVDGDFSESGSVTSGVPQGSVLGPLLFLLFINDLPKHIRNCIVKLFADDCKIYFAFKPNLASNLLQNALDSMAVWSMSSQMKIQPPKCGVLHLGKNNPKIEYRFNDCIIPAVDSVRDLGIIMTTNLSFDQHIETITKSANLTANLILRSFKYKNPKFMMQMFNVFVRSKLEYASQIWNPHHAYLIERIEKIQRRFTKRLPGLRDLSYGERLHILNSVPLELRRLHLDLIFLFKLLHGHFDIDVAKFFEFKHNRTRGHSWALNKKYSNKDQKKFFFTQRIVNIWNFLPDTVIQSATVTAFKKSLHSINLERLLRGGGLDV